MCYQEDERLKRKLRDCLILEYIFLFAFVFCRVSYLFIGHFSFLVCLVQRKDIHRSTHQKILTFIRSKFIVLAFEFSSYQYQFYNFSLYSYCPCLSVLSRINDNDSATTTNDYDNDNSLLCNVRSFYCEV